MNSALQLGLFASTPLAQFPLPRLCAFSPAAAPKSFETSTNKMLLSCTVSVHSKPFKINTCKSVSKQTTLTSFRMNTYEKTGGGTSADGNFNHSSNASHPILVSYKGPMR